MGCAPEGRGVLRRVPRGASPIATRWPSIPRPSSDADVVRPANLDGSNIGADSAGGQRRKSEPRWNHRRNVPGSPSLESPIGSTWQRWCIACWHIALLAPSLMGCASGQQGPSPSTSSTRPDAGQDVTGPKLEELRSTDAKQRAACAGGMYASPSREDLVSVEFQLRAEIPSYSQPIRVCVLVDGRRLLTDRDALVAARHLAMGETLSLRVGATPGVRHEVVLRTDFYGARPYHGFHFAVRSQKTIVISAAGGLPVLHMRLFELPVLRLEHRPSHEWSVSGPITIHPN